MIPHILLFGATGTIGRAVHAELLRRRIAVTCFSRSAIAGADVHIGNVSDPASLKLAFAANSYSAVISCLASRNGSTEDASAIDHRAHSLMLHAAQQARVPQFILLSAICVQKPLLAFQHAKLAFEAELQSSGLTWSIVRPTAYFKSLSGQIERVRAGKPFLLFGNGQLTATKPISDRDLARYIVNCLDDTKMHNRILPIGGPGPAQTPREMGEALFKLADKPARFRHVPIAMMDAIIGTLSVGGRFIPALARKAEFARIGRYYAIESMLVWDDVKKRYDAEATPAFGSDTLGDYHARLMSGTETLDLGDHAMFD